MTDFDTARLNMIDCQLRPNQVVDPLVLAAMGALPREAFVPKARRGIAYVDEDLALGGGRYLMEPLVLARLLQAAAVEPGDTVLLVGCGCGYDAAVLAQLASAVVALESDAELAAAATATLAELGVDNVAVVEAPLGDGYAQQAPYDVILIGGTVPEVPRAVLDQLNPAGGRLVAVVGADSGPAGDMGKAVLWRRDDGAYSHCALFDAGTPALPGFAAEPQFVF